MTINVENTPVQCYGGETILTASVTGGFPPYTYSWFSISPFSTIAQPIPESWYDDTPSRVVDLLITGAETRCDGTGLHTGISSHSGYCSLTLFDSVSFTCNTVNCLSTQRVLHYWNMILMVINLFCSIPMWSSGFTFKIQLMWQHWNWMW